MISVLIRFTNSNESTFFVQVDPWAGWYIVKKGQTLEILAEGEGASPIFEIEEIQDTRILTIYDSSEYFVLRDGKRIHWTEYQTNLEG
jgi:hypothetical protein